MTVTILASVFLLLVILIALIGFKAGVSSLPSRQHPDSEKCTLCRQQYEKADLIERQVGDYKLLYFCSACIASLHEEMRSKPS